jgi:hypothetical protein
MRDYNIDGVWVQRFGPRHVGWNDFTNKVLLNCKQAAETYGRVFVVMYDVSGANNSTLFNDMTNDWKYLVDTFKVTQSSRYLRHKGKPLVSIWGFGFSDRSITPDVAAKLVKWFQTDAPAQYQATVMDGVVSSGGVDWRTLAEPWASAIRSADIISPWFVGSFGDPAGADNFKTNRIVPDLAECKKLGKDYLPVVWPGFSWSNMHHGTTPQNQIPRRGGMLYWEQIYNAVSAGATMLYGAMFDEVDEGTAILKACPKKTSAPSDGWWLTLDADGYNLPSDWYLRLAGYGGMMLKKQIPLSKTMPINPAKPDSAPSIAVRPAARPPAGVGIEIQQGMVILPAIAAGAVRVVIERLNGERVGAAEYQAAGVGRRIPLFANRNMANGLYVVRVNLGGQEPVTRIVPWIR